MSSIAVSDHLLNIENDYHNVFDSVRSLSADWRKIGVGLGITFNRLRAIESNRKEVDEMLLDMIATWLERDSETQPEPTWRKLCEAVGKINRGRAKVIAQEHQCDCSDCLAITRNTPVESHDVVDAARILKKGFDEMMIFTAKEIRLADTEELRYRVCSFVKHERRVNETVERIGNETIETHLSRIEDSVTPSSILNYLYRHEFIGYINYALLKIVQEVIRSKLLDKHMKEYEKDYHLFLQCALNDTHAAFKKCPELHPNYPVGLPSFTIHLESDWDGRSMYEWKELFERRFSWPETLNVVKISGNGNGTAWSKFVEDGVKDLTNPKVIADLNKNEGMTSDISPQPQAYHHHGDFPIATGKEVFASAKDQQGTMEQSIKDDQRMTELIKTQIKKKGVMELSNVKGILIGPPNAGKTVTINRLTGKMKNIRLDGGKKSTGFDRPQTFHIYHDTEKKSIFIGKFWSDQSLDEQLGTILHCVIHRPISLKNEHDCDDPLEPLQEKVHVPVPKETQSLSVPGIPHQSISSPSQSISFPMDAYFVLLQEFIQQSRWDTVQSLLKSVNDATLFHVIDTGGQPEFFEILPLLLRGPCFSLIFLNLALSLKEPFQVTYRDTPTTHSLIEYRSTYTQLDMVHMLLASIHSLNCGKEFSQRSAAFLIGTHLDEAKSSDVIQITREIEESLKGKSFYHQDVLAKYFCHEKQLHTFLYALDNMNGSEEEVFLLRDILTHLIKSIFPAEKLPTSWGVFHLMLRHKYEEKGLCTVEESEELAKACEMVEEDEVKLALRFLHNRFGTILYYPEIESLKSLVICDPNLLFRPITHLVAKSFGANAVHPETAVAIRKSGEITNDFFEKVCNENDLSQCIPTEAIVDLLKHHNIITEIGNDERRLFMSCLLEPCTDEEKVEISSTQEVAPLLFTFYPQGYQPICLFHVLISMLLQSKEFDLGKPRFRNKIKFKAGKAMVVIRSFTSHLQVEVKKCSPKRCVQVRETLQEKLKSIVSYIPHMRDTRVDISFPCPKATTIDCSHVVKLHKFEPLEDEESSVELFCEKCDDSMDLETCHKIWFDNIDDHKSKEGSEKDLEEILSHKPAASSKRARDDDNEEELPPTKTSRNVSVDDQNGITDEEKLKQLQSLDEKDDQDSSLIMRKSPDINDAYKLLKPKAAHWSKIARELDVETGYRDELQMSASLDAKDKLESVIKKWKESECSDFTWGTLIEALRELEYIDVVRAVQEFLERPNVIRKYQNREEFLRCE